MSSDFIDAMSIIAILVVLSMLVVFVSWFVKTMNQLKLNLIENNKLLKEILELKNKK